MPESGSLFPVAAPEFSGVKSVSSFAAEEGKNGGPRRNFFIIVHTLNNVHSGDESPSRVRRRGRRRQREGSGGMEKKWKENNRGEKERKERAGGKEKKKVGAMGKASAILLSPGEAEAAGGWGEGRGEKNFQFKMIPAVNAFSNFHFIFYNFQEK